MSSGDSHRRWRVFFIPSLVILVILSVLGIANYRKNTVVLELALYSGNSWGVPQNFAYAIYDRAVEMFEERFADKGYRVVLRTGTMYKDYSEWFAQLVLKGKEPDMFLLIEEDFTTYAAIGLLERLDRYLDKSDLSPDWIANIAIWVRSRRSSFFKILLIQFRTVPSEKLISCMISLFDNPLPIDCCPKRSP